MYTMQTEDDSTIFTNIVSEETAIGSGFAVLLLASFCNLAYRDIA